MRIWPDQGIQHLLPCQAERVSTAGCRQLLRTFLVGTACLAGGGKVTLKGR